MRMINSGGSLLWQNNGNNTRLTLTQTGDLSVVGTLSKGGGSFKIDHPLDPQNKYLYHSFVESPDMLNIYDGIAECDILGEVEISLPSYFGVLNRDFKYQLTSIGSHRPLFIKTEIENNKFIIGGGVLNGKISWQVTGIRKDNFANANRIIPEVDKEAEEKGKYLHPSVI